MNEVGRPGSRPGSASKEITDDDTNFQAALSAILDGFTNPGVAGSPDVSNPPRKRRSKA